jgi:tRNA (cytidine/uridine-2'-O-)-methyltransferase
LKIVLIEPEIPQNTGNIARLAAALDVELYLVGRLGFSLSDKYLKRAGMDYLDIAVIRHIPTLEEFYTNIDDKTFFISTKGKLPYTLLPADTETLVFGSEGSGFPKYIYENYPEKLFRIPMKSGIRSLNLSSAAALTSYHLAAKHGFKGLT